MKTPTRGELIVAESSKEFADMAAALFLKLAKQSYGRFVVGLAGGSTPRPLYQTLARSPWREAVDWSNVVMVLGDERFVSPENADSNFHMIRTALFDQVGIPASQIVGVPFKGLNVEQAAAQYERKLREVYGKDVLEAGRKFFSLNFLGMGEDGHIASLLPGQTDLLEERVRWALPVTHGRPEERVTLTYPVLESSEVTVFLVSGARKREMLDRVLSGTEQDAPASRLKPQGQLIWLVDREAAGQWAGC